MTERRISDHQILIVDAPRSRIGELTDQLARDTTMDTSYVISSSKCDTNFAPKDDPAPVDKGYYQRVFGQRRLRR